jgi:PAS domain S-box-containing protein
MTRPPADPKPNALNLGEVYGDVYRIQRIFYWFIALITGGLIAGIFTVLTTGNIFSATLLFITILPVCGTYFLVRSMRFEEATVFLAIVLICMNTFIATKGLGIHHISNLAYPAILIIASLVIRRRTLAFLTLFTIGCVAWLVFGELNNLYTPGTLVRSVPGDFISSAIIIIVTAVMSRTLSDSLFQILRRLRGELAERKIAEEQYRNIFENSVHGIFQSTPDGRFVNVNPAMAAMYGFDSPDDMVQNISDIASQLYVEPEKRNSLRSRLGAGEKISGFESLDYRKDGSTFWTSMNIRQVSDENGNLLYYEGTVEDISLRKEMELKQYEAETFYRALVEQTSAVVYRDAPDNSASSIYISPQIKNLLGYTAEEWLSSPFFWKTLVHPDDLPRVLEGVETYISKKERSSIEYRLRTRAGDWRWVRDETAVVKDDDGKVLFIHGVYLDITEQKQAEIALRKNQQHLEALFNQSLVGFFFSMFEVPLEWNDTVDKEKVLNHIYYNQKFTDVNKAMLEQYGMTREAMLEQYGMTREAFLSRTSSDFFEHDPAQGLALRRKLLDQGNLHLETYERKVDGTPVWFEGDYVCMYDEQKRLIGFFGIQRDITDRKKAEESIQIFQYSIDRATDAIFWMNRSGGFSYVNEKAYISLGYTRDELMNLQLWDIDPVYPKELWDTNWESYQKDRRGGSEHVETFHRRKDGSVFPVEVTSNHLWFGNQEQHIAVVHDITERKQIEAEREKLIGALESKNAESETLRESLASLVGTFEFTEIIERILDQIRRVVPYDSASIWTLDGSIQRLIANRDLPPDAVANGMEFKINESNSALPVITGEIPYRLNNNVQAELSDFKNYPDNLIHSWLALPLKMQGRVIGLINIDGHKRDQFTEHHVELAVNFANQVSIALENSRLFSELQNELNLRKNLIAELESKNTELERFTYTVSHDLKSPLVTINGFLGYLEADINAGKVDRVKKDRERIQEAVNKMYLLLNELLELSRIGRLMNNPEVIPFDDLVHAATDIVQGRLEARGIAVRTQPGLPAIYGDRQRLIEVLQNLLDNAAKFMGDQPNPLIEIGQMGEEQGKPIFYVRDNGIGIAPKYHEQIFGLFNKLDANGDGTGIGLALVKRIIEVHTGRIWVQSEAGKGATFCFTLPISPESK